MEGSFKVSPKSYLYSSRQIVAPTDLEALLNWITPEIVEIMDQTLKDRFREHLGLAIGPLQKMQQHDLVSKLSKLPVFKKLTPCQTHSGAVNMY